MSEREAEELRDARKLLEASGLLFDLDDEVVGLWVNLNDTFGWACADGEEVLDNEVIEVARLFRDYGWCGLLYWADEKRGRAGTEFADNNRFIEFVRHEEEIKQEIPESTKRAYHKTSYTIGLLEVGT